VPSFRHRGRLDNGDAQHVITVRFAVTFGTSAFIVVLVLTILFHFGPESLRTTLLFFAALVAASGQLGAALYTARILGLTADQSVSAVVAAKDALSARFAERWTDASMFHTRNECRVLIDSRTKPNQVMANLQGSEQKATNAGNVLNFLEELSIAVLSGRCNEQMAKDLFCGIVLNIWHATEPWVRAQRVNRGRPQLWSQLEELYGRWRI
jgi:hypothetical protein